MQQLTVQEIVSDSIELFTLPDIYFQLSEMINDPRFSLVDMGQVVSKDPALSARLLKLVNSAFYGFQAKIDTISRAVVVVGIEELKNLVLATSVIDHFKEIPSDIVDMTDFWMHSIHCGILCKLLAKAGLYLHRERMFLAGLLHNIGSLLLYNRFPKACNDILLAVGNDKDKIASMEDEVIGFNHADVGGELIRRWQLPESLIRTVACYPAPHLAGTYKLDACILSMAVKLVNATEQGVNFREAVGQLPEADLSLIRISREQAAAAAMQSANEFAKVFDLLAADKRFH